MSYTAQVISMGKTSETGGAGACRLMRERLGSHELDMYASTHLHVATLKRMMERARKNTKTLNESFWYGEYGNTYRLLDTMQEVLEKLENLETSEMSRVTIMR